MVELRGDLVHAALGDLPLAIQQKDLAGCARLQRRREAKAQKNACCHPREKPGFRNVCKSSIVHGWHIKLA
jgi:hypothetical protein